jgi:hypothetical protein
MTATRRFLPFAILFALAAGPAALARDDRSAGTALRPPAGTMPALRDGSHDFDFEFGSWKAHVARRLRPLTGSSEWVELDGVSIVRPVWDGKANLGELDVRGPAGAIQGLSLRLYNPATHEWKISWANSRDGALTPAMVGAFDGRGGGEFYNADTLGDRQILARFIFSGTLGKRFRIEQAFSADAGRTWEVNWIADFTR